MQTSSPQASTSTVGQTVFAATLAAEQPGAAPAASALVRVPTQGAATTTARTTVLPRIETDGAQARLVVQTRERFEKLALLGEGGMGEVASVLDHDIGRKVAIKRLRAEARSPAVLARFVEEIRTIGKLDHPNIIPIHDVGTDADGELYFVMKYVDGETLESIIEKLAAGDPQYHHQYTMERRIEIFRALLEAVCFAHDKGVVHRDIKPANVMIGRFGEVLLMDWGIAKSLRGDAPQLELAPEGAPASPRETVRAFQTQLGSLVGTPLYMSPEQASGMPVDERSDAYSLCMLLFELLFLRHPLASKSSLDEVLAAARQEQIVVPTTEVNPHQQAVPAELIWFLRRGLEKNPAMRRSVREMIEVLNRRADGEICVDCAVTFMKSATMRSNRFVDRHPLAMMIAMSVAAMLFVTLVVFAVRGMA